MRMIAAYGLFKSNQRVPFTVQLNNNNLHSSHITFCFFSFTLVHLNDYRKLLLSVKCLEHQRNCLWHFLGQIKQKAFKCEIDVGIYWESSFNNLRIVLKMSRFLEDY